MSKKNEYESQILNELQLIRKVLERAYPDTSKRQPPPAHMAAPRDPGDPDVMTMHF